jgi:hypothetical protein
MPSASGHGREPVEAGSPTPATTENQQQDTTDKRPDEVAPTGAVRSDDTKKPEAKPDRRKLQCKRASPAEWVSAAVGFVGVIVLVFYTCFTYGLLAQSQKATEATKIAADAAKRSADVAVRTFKAQVPVVKVADVTFVNPTPNIEPDRPLDLSILLTNPGNQSAMGIIVTAGWGTTSVQDDRSWTTNSVKYRRFPQSPLRVNVLNSGSTAQKSAQINLTREEVDAIRAGKMWLFFVLHYSYKKQSQGPARQDEICPRYNGGSEAVLLPCPKARPDFQRPWDD